MPRYQFVITEVVTQVATIEVDDAVDLADREALEQYAIDIAVEVDSGIRSVERRDAPVGAPADGVYP